MMMMTMMTMMIMMIVSMRVPTSSHRGPPLKVVSYPVQKYLEHWTKTESMPYSWCVGASLQATFNARNGDGNSSEMHMMLCPKSDWTGNRRGEIGNTCKTCCDGVSVRGAQVGGVRHDDVIVKKCTWLKCCYGRRPYGGTTSLPWSMRCEQQKKLLSVGQRQALGEAGEGTRGKASTATQKVAAPR
jgi:hypothetical protein